MESNDDIDQFRELVIEDKWNEVISKYKENSYFHKIKIKGRGTALHVAVSNDYKEQVKKLVEAIINHDDKSGLRLFNERGATPLHLAAYRGFLEICQSIIGENGERKYLIEVKNKNGETPLYWAVLARKRSAFLYLYKFFPNDINIAISHNNSILHVAIQREMFDLANKILYCYPNLSYTKDKDEITPLEVLATRTSAFKSGTKLSCWKQILYFCISVKISDVKIMRELEKALKSNGIVSKEENDQKEVSIQLCDVVALEAGKVRQILARLEFRKYIVKLLHLETIKSIKKKHICGGQLLKELMKNPFESYMGIGGVKPKSDKENDHHEVGEGLENFENVMFKHERERRDSQNTTMQEIEGNKKMEDSTKNDEKETTFLALVKSSIVEIVEELNSKAPINSDKNSLLLVAMKNIKTELEEEKIKSKETAYLIAAKHGIVEMIRELQSKMKSVIHETNSNNENVLLMAVKNRQPQVVGELRKSLNREIFHSLNLEVDNNENTMLHLAAYTAIHSENTWRISGAAMQMMWDIKWYKYIKGLVPDHFSYRSNKEGKTPSEIFKEQHKELLQNSIDWLKDTAESCSVVAALIAGVSFATSGSVPGGNKDTGKPALEGQPAFEGFAISSLIGLYFSTTALIMFLSILTSRKQVEDFRKNLPLKLLLGLSSLFVSIVAMFVSFCAGHFFVLTDKYYKGNILFYLYVAICLPVTFYAIVQFPLYVDLVKVICKKVPPPSVKGVHL